MCLIRLPYKTVRLHLTWVVGLLFVGVARNSPEEMDTIME
jgi:hypothetical protein